MRNLVPWCVGIAASATLVAAGWIPTMGQAHAESGAVPAVSAPRATPTTPPTPQPAAASAQAGGEAAEGDSGSSPSTSSSPTPSTSETPFTEPRKPGDPTAPPTPREPLGSPEPAPRISDAERRASNTGFKDPSRDLDKCEVRLSAVGASFTQADSESASDRSNGTWVREGNMGDGSWAHWADQDSQVVLDGGWALGGVETGDVAQRVERSWFPVDSNLVILLGTNNLLHNSPIDQARGDIERIARTSGLAPSQIHLVQLPPSNLTPNGIDPYNQMLAETAEDNGFHLIDVSTFLNDGSGEYKDGATTDGIHLTQANAKLVGRTIAANVNATSGCRQIPAFEETAKEEKLGKAVAPPNCDLPDGRCEQEFERGTITRTNTSGPEVEAKSKDTTDPKDTTEKASLQN